MPDARSFRDFEHAGWQRAAARYGDAFGALTSQTIDPMLEALGVGPGQVVLDVATGPGFAAFAAASRGASVRAVDFSTAMVARAQTAQFEQPAALCRDLVFQEGDAEALPFPDGTAETGFDTVTMNFGLLHLARPEVALAEVHRVLKKGSGRFAYTVWAEPAPGTGFKIVLDAVEQHGRAAMDLPEGPPFFQFALEAESRPVLERIGFRDVRVERLPLVWHVASPDLLIDAFLDGAVRTAALLRAQTPDALTKIRAAVREAMKPYAASTGYELLTPAVLTTAGT